MYLLQWEGHPLKPCLSVLSVSSWPPPGVAYRTWCSWATEPQFPINCTFPEVAACLGPEKTGTILQRNPEIVNNNQHTVQIFQSVYRCLLGVWDERQQSMTSVFLLQLQHRSITRHYVITCQNINSKVLFNFPISDSSFPILELWVGYFD